MTYGEFLADQIKKIEQLYSKASRMSLHAPVDREIWNDIRQHLVVALTQVRMMEAHVSKYIADQPADPFESKQYPL